MRLPERHLTRRSSYSALASLLLALVAFLWVARIATAASAAGPAATFVKALDAYFTDQPYRTVVLVHEALAKPELASMREAGLYMLGQSFASMHLYEKAEDSLQALLAEFPSGRFA